MCIWGRPQMDVNTGGSDRPDPTNSLLIPRPDNDVVVRCHPWWQVVAPWIPEVLRTRVMGIRHLPCSESL